MRPSASPFIFVSFEYRLGQFGFLGQYTTFASIWIQFHRPSRWEPGTWWWKSQRWSSRSGIAPHSTYQRCFYWRIASQRAALKWVQRYIHNFGGDPRLFDSFFHIHYDWCFFFFRWKKKSSHNLGTIFWSEFCHVSCKLLSSRSYRLKLIVYKAHRQWWEWPGSLSSSHGR